MRAADRDTTASQKRVVGREIISTSPMTQYGRGNDAQKEMAAGAEQQMEQYFPA